MFPSDFTRMGSFQGRRSTLADQDFARKFALMLELCPRDTEKTPKRRNSRRPFVHRYKAETLCQRGDSRTPTRRVLGTGDEPSKQGLPGVETAIHGTLRLTHAGLPAGHLTHLCPNLAPVLMSIPLSESLPLWCLGFSACE